MGPDLGSSKLIAVMPGSHCWVLPFELVIFRDLRFLSLFVASKLSVPHAFAALAMISWLGSLFSPTPAVPPATQPTPKRGIERAAVTDPSSTKKMSLWSSAHARAEAFTAIETRALVDAALARSFE